MVSLRKGVKECKSCLQEITDPAQLPCGHIFCSRCISEWTKKQCKICKKEFPGDYTPTASEATRYPGAGTNLPVSSVFVLKIGIESQKGWEGPLKTNQFQPPAMGRDAFH